jgi:hypothetical protein
LLLLLSQHLLLQLCYNNLRTLTLLSSPPDTNSGGPRCSGQQLFTIAVCSDSRFTCNALLRTTEWQKRDG